MRFPRVVIFESPVFRARRAALAFVVAATLGAPAARAASQDAAAERLAESAMSEDYVAARFKDAEKKLRRAIKLCGKKNCSPQVLARVQRDLGVVSFGGLKNSKAGQQAFDRAIELDPQTRLEPDVTTPEIEAAWKAAGGEVPEPPKPEEPEPEPVKLEPEAPKPEPEAESPFKLNWVSLSLQQDLLFHSRDTAACTSSNYTCFDGNGELLAAPPYGGYGNEVRPGVGFATTRVLLGYDRLLLGRILAGARFGFAFRGAPTLPNGAKFLPVHAEVRGAYFFGEAPFTHPGLRPYASLGMGLGEVDASVGVDYYENQADYDAGFKQTAVAWRKTGKAFIAPGFGAQYAFGKASAVTAELRGLVMIGTPGLGLGINVGYAHGI